MKKLLAVLFIVLFSITAYSQAIMFPGPGNSFSGSFTQLLASQLNANDSGFSNLESRNVISAAALAAVSGTKIQVQFVPHTTTSATISKAYVGMKGASAPNYDGNQKQLLFSSSASLVLTGGGASTFSDILTFTYTSGTDLIICALYSTTFSARVNETAGANFNRYSWATGDNCAATTAPGGPTISAGQIFSIGIIQVQ